MRTRRSTGPAVANKEAAAADSPESEETKPPAKKKGRSSVGAKKSSSKSRVRTTSRTSDEEERQTNGDSDTENPAVESRPETVVAEAGETAVNCADHATPTHSMDHTTPTKQVEDVVPEKSPNHPTPAKSPGLSTSRESAEINSPVKELVSPGDSKSRRRRSSKRDSSGNEKSQAPEQVAVAISSPNFVSEGPQSAPEDHMPSLPLDASHDKLPGDFRQHDSIENTSTSPPAVNPHSDSSESDLQKVDEMLGEIPVAVPISSEKLDCSNSDVKIVEAPCAPMEPIMCNPQNDQTGDVVATAVEVEQGVLSLVEPPDIPVDEPTDENEVEGDPALLAVSVEPVEISAVPPQPVESGESAAVLVKVDARGEGEKDKKESRNGEAKRSRSRDRKRSRSPDRKRRRSDSREKKRERSRDRKTSRDRRRSKSRDKKRSRSREKRRSRSRDRHRTRSKEKRRTRSRERRRSRDRSRDKRRSRSRDRRRSRSKDRRRSKSRDRKRSRSRDRKRSRDRSRRSRERRRSRSRDRRRDSSRDKRRSKSRETPPVGSRIHLTDIGDKPSKSEIEEIFGRYGTLVDVFLSRDIPHFAFVGYATKEEADAAIAGMDCSSLSSSSMIRVSTALPRGQAPRAGSTGKPSMDEVLCYQCGRTGHFSRDCRSRISAGFRRDSVSP